MFFRIFNLHSKSIKHLNDAQENSLSLKPVLTLEEFRDVALPMLITLGPGLHRDPVLMFKVIRVVRKALTNVCIFYFYFMLTISAHVSI